MKMKDNIQKGTRIYYHGDMANQADFGIVTDRKTNTFGTDICINLDDGRRLTVHPSAFSDKYKGNGLTRFVTEVAYKEWRNEQLKQLGINITI